MSDDRLREAIRLTQRIAAPDQDLIKLAPDGLAARLGRGETPDFLEPLDIAPAQKISVWRVRR